MTWVDAVFLAVVAVSGAIGYMRGLVREVLGVGAWVGALLFAFYMLNGTRGLFVGLFPADWMAAAPWIADVAALAAVFIVTLIILKIIIALVAGAVRNSVLGGVDRALGVVFGLGRGVVVILVAYIAAGAFIPNMELWPAPVREARFMPLIADGAAWLNEQLPAQYRPRLPDPPSGRAPTAEELLRPPARNRI
ncbi:membrane protein required for colicin V production [Roseomonas rosea]|uniref:Membrane protein required for colicin V production n=1 Tax=Muricoccus roseus TaxID=198092 RepID=A0A1M6AF65_9PROT|nr:CvpA family protein [Roseomonas rosea]SHI34853.1 membrane protein required for colicin V production [Roseomonas rosea]